MYETVYARYIIDPLPDWLWKGGIEKIMNIVKSTIVKSTIVWY